MKCASHVKYTFGRSWIYFISHTNKVRIFHNAKHYFTQFYTAFHFKIGRRLITTAESKLRDLSMNFSIEILKLCDNIKGHNSLINQLERSGTSIGANICEANYAQSKADFISKLQIALKECYETEYWLELFVKSNLFDGDKVKKIYNDCGTIRRMLIASINTAKQTD